MLVDNLVALPMEHVVRMARLTHENLRHACSFRYVKNRMTHVTFRVSFRAHRTGGEVAATFSTSSVLKRLDGKVEMHFHDLENTEHIDSCLDLAKKVSGKLYLNSKSSDEGVSDVAHRNIVKIRKSFSNQTKLTFHRPLSKVMILV